MYHPRSTDEGQNREPLAASRRRCVAARFACTSSEPAAIARGRNSTIVPRTLNGGLRGLEDGVRDGGELQAVPRWMFPRFGRAAHPSSRFMNHAPGNCRQILRVLTRVTRYLAAAERPDLRKTPVKARTTWAAPNRFIVDSIDNYESPGERRAVRVGEFATAKEAVACARKIVDESLMECRSANQSPSQWYQNYVSTGEGAFAHGARFDQRKYAKERIRQLTGVTVV